jgi:hypothetical protein
MFSSAWEGNKAARLRKRGALRGRRIPMHRAGAARAAKMKNLADLRSNTRCATLRGMAVTTNPALYHRALAQPRSVPRAEPKGTPVAPLTGNRAALRIGKHVQTEFTLTRSEQRTGTNATRSRFRAITEPNLNPPRPGYVFSPSATCGFLVANPRSESLATHSKQSAASCPGGEKVPAGSHTVLPGGFYTNYESRIINHEEV